jgi:DNA segregation ATPase FtsK/SpoIIIE, S-DNA-T family
MRGGKKMIFETIIGATIGGLFLGAKRKTNGTAKASDHEKIIMIAESCGLKKDDKTIRLHRKTVEERFVEYVYQLPYGLTFKKFEQHIREFEDGLNIKKREYVFNRRKLKEVWFYIRDKRFNRKTFRKDLHSILFDKVDVKKHVEMFFDGMLHFKVFDEELGNLVEFNEEFLKGCKDWKVPLGDDGERLLTWKVGREHMGVAGGTRQGKTQFLKLFITSLVHLYPERIKFSLVDLKGGVSFQRYKNLKQTFAFADDIHTTTEVLDAVYKEMMEKQQKIREMGVETADEAGMKEKHFIIIDEAAELSPIIKKDEKNKRNQCQQRLSEIARLGAGLNYILVFCTQYPTVDVMSKDIKSNLNQVVCFKLRSGNQSQVVLDEWGAEKLKCPGRAIVLDGVERHEVQVPLMKDEFIQETITPHIVIKPRKDEEQHENSGEDAGKERIDSLVVEEIGIY